MPKLLALLRSPSIRSSALLALTGLGFDELAQLNVPLGLTLGVAAIAAAVGAGWGLSSVVSGVEFSFARKLLAS
jgi:hypothetical protein